MDFRTTRSLSSEAFGTPKLLQVGTRNFREWFGQSKVVDQSGSPLRVYHGTQFVFDSFSEEMQGSTVCSEDIGFFFTNDTAEANAYATWDWDRDIDDIRPNIIPVYLSAQNPLLVNISNPNHLAEQPGVWYDRYGPNMARYALICGHDSLIISDFECGERNPERYFSGKKTLYVVFQPSQIKSALGNSGRFDPRDCRIDQ